MVNMAARSSLVLSMAAANIRRKGACVVQGKEAGDLPRMGSRIRAPGPRVEVQEDELKVEHLEPKWLPISGSSRNSS